MASADVPRSRVALGMEGAKKSIDRGAKELAIANMKMSWKLRIREIPDIEIQDSAQLITARSPKIDLAPFSIKQCSRQG